MKIAHVEASNVVPSFASSQVFENIPKKVMGNPLKSDLLENLTKGKDGRLKKILESLNLPRHRVMDLTTAAVSQKP